MIKFNQPLKIKVQTKANKNIIIESDSVIKVKITESPENNKANYAIIKLFSKTYKTPQNNIEILKGAHSSDKIILIKKY
ncbi:MAG: DUF167 domain-containing protein [Rickettsiales bacterium]|jgi:uncharacterized protein (TIGR00251 family)|nr:DUF167 domain-containing protein [Rickettsiales bacterium]